MCRDTGELIAWECGDRDKATLKKLIDRLEDWQVKVYYNASMRLRTVPGVGCWSPDGGGPYGSITDGTWSLLLENRGAPKSLFRLPSDPEQLND